MSGGAVDKGLYSACFLGMAEVKTKIRREKGYGLESYLLMCE